MTRYTHLGCQVHERFRRSTTGTGEFEDRASFSSSCPRTASFYTLELASGISRRYFALTPPPCDPPMEFSSTTEHLLLPTATDLKLFIHMNLYREFRVSSERLYLFFLWTPRGTARTVPFGKGLARVLCHFTLLRIPKDRDTIFSTSRVLIEVRRSEDPFPERILVDVFLIDRARTRETYPENNAKTH